jgi:hypothetical protein
LKDRGRRTDDRGQKEVRGKMLEVGGAALRALRLEAKDRKKSEVGRLRTDDGGQTSAGRWQKEVGDQKTEDRRQKTKDRKKSEVSRLRLMASACQGGRKSEVRE